MQKSTPNRRLRKKWMNVAKKFGFPKKNMVFSLKDIFTNLGVDKLKGIYVKVNNNQKTKEVDERC